MRNSLIVVLKSTEYATKVEETVKTGYVETPIVHLAHWAAVEEDLAESYGRLAEESKEAAAKSAYQKLQRESKTNIAELSKLLKSLEGLDRARVKRIELLSALHH